jgi:hypothetical protein
MWYQVHLGQNSLFLKLRLLTGICIDLVFNSMSMNFMDLQLH